MHRFFPFLIDRRVWLLGLTSLLAALLGFYSIPDYAAIVFVSKAGFWFVLAAFGIFLSALWQSFAPEFRGLRWQAFDGWTVVLIGICGTVLMVHEAFGFKIVMDEIMLLGTSMSMHLDRTVLTPVRGQDIQGTFVILDGMMDKRPLFFPFLCSVLHDLTGYRPQNAFVLNGVLTFGLLGLINAIGRQLAGRIAGWLGMILLTGLPLLAHNATGGGFDLLNIVMIAATLLLGARFWQKRDAPALTAFCYSALLLAQVRYESVIFLLPAAALVLWVWGAERRPILSWATLFAPLLMIHYPLQHRIFDLRASSWELASKPGYAKVFSPEYIPENLQHGLNFFFAQPADQPNSLVLSTIGFIAVPFFLLLCVRRASKLSTATPVEAATWFFAFGFAVQFALLMCYFWGKFDDVVIRRLSLPTQLGMVIAVMAVVPQFKPIVARTLTAIAGFGLLASGVPSMAAHAYSQEYLPGREVAWRRAFIAEQPRHDYFVIDNDSILWIAHQVSSTSVLQVTRHPELLEFHMRNRTFSDVFVFQRFDIDPADGRMTPRKGDDLGPNFVLETVREERLQALTLSRLSRVKSIRDAKGNVVKPDTATHVVPKSREEIERMRRLYLENFVKMLP